MGLNRYAYAGNDPINNSDPSGLQAAYPQTLVGTEEDLAELARQSNDFRTGARDEVINDLYETAAMADRYGPGSRVRQALGISLPEGPLIEGPANPSREYEAGGWAAFGAGLLGIGKAAVDFTKFAAKTLAKNAKKGGDKG